MKFISGKRVLVVSAGLAMASTLCVITGCSQSEKTTNEVAFKKTPPPAAYADWQKKMAAGTLGPAAPTGSTPR